MRPYLGSWTILCGLCLVHGVARAQPTADSAAVADAWARDALQQEATIDTFGRYVAAPAAVLLGGFALVGTAVGELSPGTAAAYALTGTLMLTGAAGVWVNPDPYTARLWFARSVSLAFTALGAGLLLNCAADGGFCRDNEFGRHLVLAAGVLDIGVFVSNFVLTLVAPPPSAGALDLSIRDRPPAERNARVREFLERRERTRRLGNYVSFPWVLGFSVTQLAIAHEAPTSEGRALAYGIGGFVLALSTGLFVSELLRETDVERFDGGELP
jgi:hypothetical protein